MSFALFPTWIKATLAGASAAFLGKALTFSVTHKTKQASGSGLRHVRPQLVAMAALAVAGVYGAIQAEAGNRPLFATVLTLFWVVMDLALLGIDGARGPLPRSGQTLQNPLPANVGAEVDAVVDEIERQGPFERVTAATDPTIWPSAPRCSSRHRDGGRAATSPRGSALRRRRSAATAVGHRQAHWTCRR